LNKNECKLQEFYFSENDLNHDSIIAFYHVLAENNTSLKLLDVSRPTYNSIMQETAFHCNKMLRSNSSLEILNLSKHKLRHDGI